jgi:hypothetical protein
MSSSIDLEEPETVEELEQLDETTEVPPGAFYLALKNALIQLENQPTTYP